MTLSAAETATSGAKGYWPHSPGPLQLMCAVIAAAVTACSQPNAPSPGAEPQPKNQSSIDYVVPPMRISPDHGLRSEPPFFREAQLLVTEKGPVVAFMEDPSNAHSTRVGWTCTSTSGKKWLCGPVNYGPGGTDWADPWLADTRGDPCPS